MTAKVVGLDVGGANLKAADGRGRAVSVPFPLWRRPADLAGAVAGLLADFPAPDLVALTMTGELCDCFATKRDGVWHILDAVARAAPGVPVRVWRHDGAFASAEAARADPLPAAAANWLALAALAARLVSSGVLIDVGSTTADVIALEGGAPRPVGRTDPGRLRRGELVYTGVRRTPVCALLGGEGAAELFATTLDVYLVLGRTPQGDHTDTADGRPATREAAHARLARMLCADLESSTEGERLELARQMARRQHDLIAAAVGRVAGRPAAAVVAGEGEWLAREVALALGVGTVISLREALGEEVSRAACAHAVAVLAREECQGAAGG